MCLQFGFVIFWRKDFGAKAANKMLVISTPGGRNWQQIYPNYPTKNILARDEHPSLFDRSINEVEEKSFTTLPADFKGFRLVPRRLPERIYS